MLSYKFSQVEWVNEWFNSNIERGINTSLVRVQIMQTAAIKKYWRIKTMTKGLLSHEMVAEPDRHSQDEPTDCCPYH